MLDKCTETTTTNSTPSPTPNQTLTPNTKAQILKEYRGPGNPNEQDILFLLRPQANNCYFESLLLSTLHSSKEYKKTIWLEYLANIPGEMIQKNKLMERHYEYRLFYAQHGSETLSNSMKLKFKKQFTQTVEESNIVGAYKALEILELTPVELFHLHPTHKKDYMHVNGQSIKRFTDKKNNPLFVINSDIPALMEFNHLGTNSAVMVFRTTLDYKQFNRLVLETLIKICYQIFHPKTEQAKGIVAHLSTHDLEDLKGKDFFRHKRLFHYSHGPFEQILDMRDFLYNPDGTHVELNKISFVNYLENKGIDLQTLTAMLRNPVIQINENKQILEESLYVYTRNMSFEKAYKLFNKISSQQVTKIKNLYDHD